MRERQKDACLQREKKTNKKELLQEGGGLGEQKNPSRTENQIKTSKRTKKGENLLPRSRRRIGIPEISGLSPGTRKTALRQLQLSKGPCGRLSDSIPTFCGRALNPPSHARERLGKGGGPSSKRGKEGEGKKDRGNW